MRACELRAQVPWTDQNLSCRGVAMADPVSISSAGKVGRHWRRARALLSSSRSAHVCDTHRGRAHASAAADSASDASLAALAASSCSFLASLRLAAAAISIIICFVCAIFSCASLKKA